MPFVTRDAFVRRLRNIQLTRRDWERLWPDSRLDWRDRRLARFLQEADNTVNAGNGNRQIDTDRERAYLFYLIAGDELDRDRIINSTGLASVANLEEILLPNGATEWRQMAVEMGFREGPAVGVPPSSKDEEEEDRLERARVSLAALVRLYRAERAPRSHRNDISMADVERQYLDLWGSLASLSPEQARAFVDALDPAQLTELAHISLLKPTGRSRMWSHAGGAGPDGTTLLRPLVVRLQDGAAAAKVLRAWQGVALATGSSRRDRAVREQHLRVGVTLSQAFLSGQEAREPVAAFVDALGEVDISQPEHFAVGVAVVSGIIRLHELEPGSSHVESALARVGERRLVGFIDGMVRRSESAEQIDRSLLVDLVHAASGLDRSSDVRRRMLAALSRAPAVASAFSTDSLQLDLGDRQARLAAARERFLALRAARGDRRSGVYAYFALAIGELSPDEVETFINDTVISAGDDERTRRSFLLLVQGATMAGGGAEVLGRVAASSTDSRDHLIEAFGRATSDGLPHDQYVTFARTFLAQARVDDQERLRLIDNLVENLDVEEGQIPDRPPGRDDPSTLFHPAGMLIAELTAELQTDAAVRRTIQMLKRRRKLHAVARSAVLPEPPRDSWTSYLNLSWRRPPRGGSNDARPLIRMIQAVARSGGVAERGEMLAASMEAVRVGIARNQRRALGLAGMETNTSAVIDATLDMLLPDERLTTFKIVKYMHFNYGEGRYLGLLHMFGLNADGMAELMRTEGGRQVGDPFARPPHAPGDFIGRFYELYDRVSHDPARGIGPVEWMWVGNTQLRSDPRYREMGIPPQDIVTGEDARIVIGYLRGSAAGGLWFTLRSIVPVLQRARNDENLEIRLHRELYSMMGIFSDLGKRWSRGPLPDLPDSVKQVLKVSEILLKIERHYYQTVRGQAGIEAVEHRRSAIGQLMYRLRGDAVLPLLVRAAQDRYREELDGRYDTFLRADVWNWFGEGEEAGRSHLADSFLPVPGGVKIE